MALLMVSLGSFVVLMSQHVAQEQAQETLERALLRQAQDIMKFRNFYAADIMAPAQSHGARVSHDYKDHPGTLPLPATMVIELGHFFNQQEFGSRMAYYSDMPFPWRAADRQLDGFQQNALLALRNNPNQAYIREEQRDGQTVVRLALADRMQEACVNCHNNSITEMFELAMSEQISSWALDSSGNWVRSQFDSEGNTLSDFQDTIMKSIAEPRGK